MVDLGVLEDEVEAEIRSLHEMREMALRLAPERYADLQELICSKLTALLPDVLDSLAPGIEPPIAPAIEAAAQEAPHDVQLAALDKGLEATANELDAVATEVTSAAAARGDPVTPYFSRTVERVVGVAQRIGATLRRIDAALAAISGTIAGRKVARLGYVSVRSAGGVAVASAAAAADVPYTGNVQTATVAVVSAVIGNRLYARRRQADPSLPPSLDQSNDTQGEQPDAGDH